jgi:hypothetical protein
VFCQNFLCFQVVLLVQSHSSGESVLGKHIAEKIKQYMVALKGILMVH